MKIKKEVLLNVLKKDLTKCFNKIKKDQLRALINVLNKKNRDVLN